MLKWCPAFSCDVSYGEICVLDKLPADMSYGAFGCEFYVNESTISMEW